MITRLKITLNIKMSEVFEFGFTQCNLSNLFEKVITNVMTIALHNKKIKINVLTIVNTYLQQKEVENTNE